eukprot:3059518-Alexandrium_andersonii.AAC.1
MVTVDLKEVVVALECIATSSAPEAWAEVWTKVVDLLGKCVGPDGKISVMALPRAAEEIEAMASKIKPPPVQPQARPEPLGPSPAPASTVVPSAAASSAGSVADVAEMLGEDAAED